MDIDLVIEDRQGHIVDEVRLRDGEFRLGRSSDNDIVLPSDSVSRRHALIRIEAQAIEIVDLGSANGVYVNGRRVVGSIRCRGPVQVRAGDYFLRLTPDDGALGSPWGVLHGLNLALAGRSFPLPERETIVGRGREAGIALLDASVSRAHARIEALEDGTWSVTDLDSSNGTFVNDRRVERAIVHPGDVVRFGNVEVRLERARDERADLTGATQLTPSGAGAIGPPSWSKWVAAGIGTVGVVLAVALILSSPTAPSPPRASRQSAPPPSRQATARPPSAGGSQTIGAASRRSSAAQSSPRPQRTGAAPGENGRVGATPGEEAVQREAKWLRAAASSLAATDLDWAVRLALRAAARDGQVPREDRDYVDGIAEAVRTLHGPCAAEDASESRCVRAARTVPWDRRAQAWLAATARK